MPDFNIRCLRHKKEVLRTTPHSLYGIIFILVDPCYLCQGEAYDEGYEDGKDDLYCKGSKTKYKRIYENKKETNK